MTFQRLKNYLPAAILIAILGLDGLINFLHPDKSYLLIIMSIFAFGGALAIIRTRLFIYFLLFSIIVGQLIRIRLTNDSSASLLLVDLASLIYTIGGIIAVLVTKKKIPTPISSLFLLAFLGWMVLTLLIGSPILETKDVLGALFYQFRFFLMIGVIFVTATLFPTEREQSKIQNYLLFSGLLLTLLGYIQLIIFPSFAFMSKFGWDPHSGRLLSTFFDPNFFGFFLVIIASISLVRLLYNKDARFWPTIIFIVSVVATILTFSRSSYVALVISLFIILCIRSWKLMIISTIALGLVASTIPRVRNRIIGAVKIDPTAQDRIESWKETFEIIRNRPITGVGYNAYGPAQVRYGFKKDLLGHSSRGSDSSLLLVLATTGIIGFVLYLLFWLSILFETFLVARFSDNLFFTNTARILLGLIPAYLVHSQFVNSLFYPLIFIPIAILIATLWVGLVYVSKK